LKLRGKHITIVLFSILIASCHFLQEKNKQKAIARVQEQYLYKEDLLQSLPKGLSKADSLLFVNQYIQNWATQQILKQKARLNLSEKTQQQFEKLAEDYKLDLYTNAYLDALISAKMDTLISKEAIDTLYQKTKDNFKLNETLVKFRYISIEANNTNIDDYSKRLKRYDSLDKVVLDSLSIQFDSYMLNDTIWVKQSQVLKKIPILKNPENFKRLKKSNFLQLKDSLKVYLVHIKDVLHRNECAPQQYVTPTLKQIILNKRKLKQIKQLKIELRNNAEQNNEFEIYN